MTVRTPVYLDHHATTPPDPRVVEAMLRVLREQPGNAASSTHAFGWAAAALVEQAREHVAALIGATAREIVFTSGATEAANLAVLGVAEARGEAGHMVLSGFEHEAVAAPAARLAAGGWRIDRVPAGADGVVAPGDVASALRPDTLLVAVMAAQNEIGTLQPVAEVGALCKERGVLFLCDAAQAAGRVPVDVSAQGIDLLALSAHKLHGPQGVGALYVRRRDPRVALAPRQLGGDQERGLRAGTLNVPGIVGFGEACRLAAQEMAGEGERLTALRDGLWETLRTELPGVTLNGDPRRRLPGNLNVSFAGVRAHSLLGAVTRLAVSSGSACSSAESAPSPVLTGIGVPPELAAASLRIGLGRFTTAEEVTFAGREIVAAVRRLRARG